MAHDVFICHSSKDRTIANAICATLEQQRIRCWIAPRDVLPGSDYATSIVEAVSATRLTVLIFSENSNQSPHVRREIERTVSRGIPILPFRVEDVVPSPSLEYFISDAHWLDALTPPLEQHLQQLVGVVQALLASLPATPLGAPVAVAVVQEPSPAERESTIAPAQIAPGSSGTILPRRPRVLIAGIVGVGSLVVLGLVGAIALAPSSPAVTSPSPAVTSPSPEARLVAESALLTGDCLLTGGSRDCATWPASPTTAAAPICRGASGEPAGSTAPDGRSIGRGPPDPARRHPSSGWREVFLARVRSPSSRVVRTTAARRQPSRAGIS